MPNLTIKSVPDELYQRLKQSASEHRRSMNREVIVCLERSLLSKRIEPGAFLARVDALREKIALPPLTEKILRAAKSTGRP
ncbi:FitA-like ribbon-helix-helix domain-containing protein [Candidatus Methylomirabilis sp.]|uniref:FitA-like ribbon-helix-helix domain-containing protein n=1 Tax=Candidatus Methylomirabilis sp. TaxID=2032687 RepID=UPI003C76EB68